MDSAVQQVRDSFAISTKVFDQISRSGAFHQLIRRKVVAEDTGLCEIKDIKGQIMGLPLSKDGVFGQALKTKLKERAETTKQMKELLPEISVDKNKRDYGNKRKFSQTHQYTPSASTYVPQYSAQRGNNIRPQRQSNYGHKPTYNTSRPQPAATDFKPLGDFRIPKMQRK